MNRVILIFLLLVTTSLWAKNKIEEDVSKKSIKVLKLKDRKSVKGTSETFTGDVSVELLISVNEPSRLTGASVTFAPGARSHWHSHPLGQNLIVTEGVGRVQQWGGPVQEIKTGDVIWTPPGVKHWHGASPDQKMSHLAIQEKLDGSNVQWREPVSEQQYKMKVLK